MRKQHSLKLEIYLVDQQGNRKLIEETTTSPDSFLEQFPVHKSQLFVTRQQDSLIIKEEDNHKNETYLAVVTCLSKEEETLRELKELFVLIRAQIW